MFCKVDVQEQSHPQGETVTTQPSADQPYLNTKMPFESPPNKASTETNRGTLPNDDNSIQNMDLHMEDHLINNPQQRIDDSLIFSERKGLQENAFRSPPIRQTQNSLKSANTGTVTKRGPRRRSNQERLRIESLESVEGGTQTQIDQLLGSKKPKVTQC